MTSDVEYMREALAEGGVAFAAGDVPVGAVVVLGGAIVGRGHNRREVSGDPTAHAEVEALRDAARKIGHWRIEGTLYVTQEPCPMCAGALVNARVVRLVYGCDNPKAGAVRTLFAIPTDARLNHRVQVEAGVLAEESAALLRVFFQARRAELRKP